MKAKMDIEIFAVSAYYMLRMNDALMKDQSTSARQRTICPKDDHSVFKLLSAELTKNRSCTFESMYIMSFLWSDTYKAEWGLSRFMPNQNQKYLKALCDMMHYQIARPGWLLALATKDRWNGWRDWASDCKSWLILLKRFLHCDQCYKSSSLLWRSIGCIQKYSLKDSCIICCGNWVM